MLTRKLAKVRDALLSAGRRHEGDPAKRAKACELADWVEEAIDRLERIKFLEASMRSANEAIRALIDDDRAKRAQIADLQAQLAAAQANAVSADNLAGINELVPEEPAPTPPPPAQ
jgi:multidrug efflux pump subunit AcrA (membrane-fusion protein)